MANMDAINLDVNVRGLDDAKAKLMQHLRAPELIARVAAMRDGGPKELCKELLELYQATNLLMLDYKERALKSESFRAGVWAAWRAARHEDPDGPLEYSYREG